MKRFRADFLLLKPIRVLSNQFQTTQFAASASRQSSVTEQELS